MEKTLEMRVEELERMLFMTKNVLSFDEASAFLCLSKSYLYKLTSGNLIPTTSRRGRCSISRSPNWRHATPEPVKTKGQIEQEAQKYVLNRPLKK